MASSSTEKENPLCISWHDSAWIPVLNRDNVMVYFSERSNPFYDRQCNNEIIKMQRLSTDHLQNMVGTEYILLHFQEQILYVIRKQHRSSPTQVTPLADYYIVAGTVYCAPDIRSVVNSRLTTSLHHLQCAFTEAASYSRYHPSKGYWWQFKDESETETSKTKTIAKKTEAPGSMFQVRKVDQLLAALTLKFPHKYYQAKPGEAPVPVSDQQKPSNPAAETQDNKPPQNINIQQEPAAEKRAKFT